MPSLRKIVLRRDWNDVFQSEKDCEVAALRVSAKRLIPIPAAIKKIRLFGAETDRGYLAYRKYNITWSFLECRAMVIPQMLERERLKKSKKEAAP